MVKESSRAYDIIAEYYGDKTAKRSGVKLINHINEGLRILEWLKVGEVVKDAYCLHPLLQSDDDLMKNMGIDFTDVDTQSLILAIEYRRVANSYLSYMDIDSFVGFTCREIKAMLLADKVQNYKDFMLYHYGTHEHSDRLYQYFHNWFDLLDIEPVEYEHLKQIANNGVN